MLENLWPEAIRMLLRLSVYQPERDKAVLDSLLAESTPATFNSLFNEHQKLSFLEAVVNALHKIHHFPEHLEHRLDKLEAVHDKVKEYKTEIKAILKEKKEHFDKQALYAPAVAQAEEKILLVKNDINNASRTEAKRLWETIQSLEEIPLKHYEELKKLEKFDARVRKLEEKIQEVKREENKNKF